MKVETGLVVGKGLGDVVADFTHATGVNKLADLYTNVTGKDCGCAARQDALNQIVPNILPG
ncbi:MAG: hypothetical protein HY327_06115 [Chloroflexi bacterium]|nr:hypothetical protein [Chloroflexota bacterium]